jgi:hypothetical protein
MTTTQQLHAIERTSPKGQPFVGRCRLCQATGLKPKDALAYCENPMRFTEAETLVNVLTQEKP